MSALCGGGCGVRSGARLCRLATRGRDAYWGAGRDGVGGAAAAAGGGAGSVLGRARVAPGRVLVGACAGLIGAHMQQQTYVTPG